MKFNSIGLQTENKSLWQMLCQNFIPDRILHFLFIFCLVLNEIWNKRLVTIPVIDKRANRRSNSQWNITLLDYKQKIYRSAKCYARILYQIEFYNFCLVLNEIWNKLLLTIPVIDKRANMLWYCIRTRALGDSFFYNSPAPAFLFLLMLNV
jgi:hypothetical protein